MGQEIVYCYRCQTRLMGSDFDKGKAFRVGDQISCDECVRGLFSSLPPAQIDAEIAHLKEVQLGKKFSTSSRIPVVKGSSPDSSAKLKTLPAADEPSPSKLPLILGGAAVLAALVLAAVAFLPSRSEPARTAEAPTPAPPVAPPPTPTPEPDLHASAFADVDRAIAARVERDDYSAAARDLEKARGRRPEAAWNAGIDDRRTRLEEAARAALPRFLEPALSAHQEGRADEVDRLRGFIAAFPALALEFDRRLATSSTPAPTPPPKPSPAPKPTPKAPSTPKPPPAPKPPAEPAAWRKSWDDAMALRSAAGARAALEKAAGSLMAPEVKAEAAKDVDLLKRAESVRAGGLAALAKAGKDQKVRLDVRDDAMGLGSFEGTVVASDATLVRLATEAGTLDLPVSELSEESIGRLYAERPGHGPDDAQAAAVWCCLRGEGAGARKLDPALPEKYAEFGDRVPPPSPDAEARRAFWSAYTEFGMTRSRASGLEQLSRISSPRFKAFIEQVLESGKDSYFAAPDLSSSGAFSLVERDKVGAALLSTADNGKTWAEAEYYSLPDQTYRAWAYVGGCCLEVLGFSLQATGLRGADPRTKLEASFEPGDPAALPVKLSHLSLKKVHSQHLGPKEPDRWEWVPLTLPKAEAPGVKKIRIVHDQKGFAVAHLVVSASRRGPPSPTELKELLKDRSTAPRFLVSSAPARGKPTRTAYLGGRGGTEFEDRAPPGAVLVGFRYNVKTGRGNFKFLQPIYRLAEQTTSGGGHGSGDASNPEIVARPGYAVGQVIATATDRFDGCKIVFMRLAGGRLLPGDRYESPWIGVPAKGEPQTIGDGSPVGGVFGRKGGEIDGAGLILLK